MIAEFKLCKSGSCGINVIGLEQDGDSYLAEYSVLPHFKTYKWSESVTINAIKSVSVSDIETLIKYEIKDHNIFPIDDSTFEMPSDGIYSIYHVIIPNKNWLDYILEKDPKSLEQYSSVIYYDTDNDSIIKYDNGHIEISIEEVFKQDEKSSVVLGIKNTFNTCYINNCFYKINKQLLNLIATSCKTNDSISDLIYKRDVLWMGINAIKYSIDIRQLYEAQRILDQLNQCHALCNDTIINLKYSDCGCN